MDGKQVAETLLKPADVAPDERTIQATLFRWKELQQAAIPELRCLFAVPNGQYRPGERPEPGLTAGVPDVCLPVQRGEHGALWIELKTKTGRLRDSQREWLRRLRKHGHATAVCRSFDDAKAAIMDYLGDSFDPSSYTG